MKENPNDFKISPQETKVVFHCNESELKEQLTRFKGERIKFMNGTVKLTNESIEYISSKSIPMFYEDSSMCFVPNEVMEHIKLVDDEKKQIEISEQGAEPIKDVFDEITDMGYKFNTIKSVNSMRFLAEITSIVGRLSDGVIFRNDVQIQTALADLVIQATLLGEKEVVKMDTLLKKRIKQYLASFNQQQEGGGEDGV